MDDFDDEELYDYYNQIEEDDDFDDESLKDKYERAKDYKEKYDKYKKKYDDYKNNSANKSANNVGKNAGKDVAKQGGKEAAKQGGKEAAKEGGKKAGEQIAKEAGKKATTEAGKQVAKEGAKIAAKEGAKVAAEGAAASTGVGIIVAVAIEVADRLNKIKKKIDKKVDKKIEENTGIKDASKKKKYLPLLLIFAIFMFIFVVPAMAMFALSDTATSELTTLVRAREENNKSKKLILFTKAEFKELLNKDIEISEDIAKKLADEGYTLQYENDKYKSLSYKSILKGYGSDLTNVFAPMDLTGAADGMDEVLEDGTSYDSLNDKDKDVAVSLKNVKKYLMAEIDNFNEGVKWQTTNLKTTYLNVKSESFNNYSDFENNSVKVVSDGAGSLESKTVTNKNYTVEDDEGKNTMLKMPKLSDYGVNVSSYGGENKAARKFVDMLEPYMQKWIIPYTMYIDTQDEDFVDGVMNYMYHPANVSIFQLKKLVKTINYEYYMICHKYKRTIVTTCTEDGCSTSVSEGPIYARGSNTKDSPVGSKFISSTSSGNTTTTVYEITEVTEPYEIATDSSGNPLVKKINISRKIEDADSIPELVSLESFYEILNREYVISPINENNGAASSTASDLSVNTGNGIGKQTIVDEWNETLQMKNSKTEKYKVSYYTDEQLEDLGRDISRVEWYQDVMGGSFGAINASGEFGSGANKFEQAYNGAYKETLERIWDGIVSWGYTEEQAAAIIGNIAQESTFNVTAVNSIGATGLCQWLGGRRDMLYSFAAQQGTTWSDLTTQLQFLCMEVSWDERYSFASYQWSGHGQDLAAFKSGTVEEAAVGFRKGFERCGEAEANDAVRISCARSAYETFSGRTIQYPIEKIAASSTSSGEPGGSITGAGLGMGETLYSYDDMYFAYYQIEQWYAKSTGFLSTNTVETVKLPEGGFAWPVKITSGNEEAKSIYRFAVVGHSGIDISTGNVSYFDNDANLNKGELVVATHNGTVTKVQNVTDENKNAYIEIKTDDGNFKTKYCYLSEIYVAEGDVVAKNQEIGRIGKTGAKAGIHGGGTELFLHYEMYYKGQNMDPLTYYNISCNGVEVEDYDELDLGAITNPKEYKYESSKTYLGNGGAVVEFAAQYLGYDLNTLQNLRGSYLNDHWCAWFASWCLRECGIDAIECSNTNYCPTIWNETKGVKHPYGDGYVPNPGDIIMFYSPDKGCYSHIAIVSKVENGVVHWIGGNQGGNCPFGSKVTEASSDSRLKSYITY